MRLHTNILTTSDIYTAARFARVDVVHLSEHGSRSRGRAFDVKLEGESHRRPNGGTSGVAYGSGYAATWDQWGVFLSVLFDLDPTMTCTYYPDRAAFHTRTDWRFCAEEIVGYGTSTNANVVNVYRDGIPVHRIADHYWPADAHGDHTFRYAGTPREQSCTKCSAVQRWEVRTPAASAS